MRIVLVGIHILKEHKYHRPFDHLQTPHFLNNVKIVIVIFFLLLFAICQTDN